MGDTNLKNQSWIRVFIYQLITLGIYGIFWIINIRKDAKIRNNEDKINILSISLYSIFAGLGFISFFLSFFPNFIDYSNLQILKVLTRLFWFLSLDSIFRSRKYLKETYGIESNIILTILFSVIYLQARITNEYSKIKNYKNKN